MGTFTASVITGQGKGRLLGTPTLNLDLNDVPTWLTEGVYAVRANGLPATMHVGPRPTLGFGNSCEIHLLSLDNNKDLSPSQIHVEPIVRLRDVQDFKNEQTLKEQIAKDIKQAREMLQ